jgi:ribonucleoside-triphosphate reductase (formate)
MRDYVTENASERRSYVGDVFNEGSRIRKELILNSLKPEWRNLHNSGHIHIHDLDAYGETYNCLALNILNRFPYNKFEGFNDLRKILGVFNHLIDTLTKLGNEQSGGMSFANFDNDVAEILMKLHIELTPVNREAISDSINSLILWCNNCHERMGQVSYYITLNIGLADNDLARFVAESVLNEFENGGKTIFKPNIVFKVKSGVNLDNEDPNHYLLKKALICTSKCMIPTYLLCDSAPNRSFEAEKLSIMGCRTRVATDTYGNEGSIGRGNIDYITINLPHIALEINQTENRPVEEKISLFKEKWTLEAGMVKDILMDRYNRLIESKSPSDFVTNYRSDLWCVDFSTSKSVEDIFKHGTLSIGFIGLSETLEILTGKRFYDDDETYRIALDLVSFMRGYCDSLIKIYGLNFSLLATSGEFISGRFPEIDSSIFSHPVLDKGFYTNSFHINVDSGLSVFDKIEKEGLFHLLCNGGCISYVELGEAPIYNDEALYELILKGVQSGTSYLGFNFPLNICKTCGSRGTFDVCPECGSREITRVLRVSGYLEVVNYFTSGKSNEARMRTRN